MGAVVPKKGRSTPSTPSAIRAREAVAALEGSKGEPKAAPTAPHAAEKASAASDKGTPALPKVPPPSLADLARAAVYLVDAERETERIEEMLKAAKERERVLREETIPWAMLELELRGLPLASGESIAIKQEVYVSVSEERKPKAFAWLEEQKLDGIIQTVVSVAYGRGELKEALALVEKLKKLKKGKGKDATSLEPDFSRTVNTGTLKATLRELLANAKDFPMELFGARAVWTTTVKSPRAKKASK